MPRVESCPYWYSTRVLSGIEQFPTEHDYTEKYVGIRCTFLTPIIPIPICSEEKVFKLGRTTEIFDKCKYEHLGKYYALLMHYKEYDFARIACDCTVHFSNLDLTYKNDEVWQWIYSEEN